MKHIITTVGTSVYSNFLRKDDLEYCYQTIGWDEISIKGDDVKSWSEKRAKKYRKDNASIKNLEDKVKKYWLRGISYNSDEDDWDDWGIDNSVINTNASAEIKSICKIISESDDTKFKVYLICSDTAIGKSAGYLVKMFFEGYSVDTEKYDKPTLLNRDKNKVSITVSPHSPSIVDDLIIDDATLFIENSINNLLSRVDNVRNQKGVEVKDIVLNISGGYKALIPIMTIYAQVRKIDICYIYESSENLIQITPFPINFEYELLASTGIFLQSTLLKAIDRARSDVNEFEELAQKLEEDKLIQITPNKLKTTPLGGILSSLSTSEIQGDFGDKVIEDSLKDFFNDSARTIHGEYYNASGKRRIDKPLSISGCTDIHISETDIELERASNTKVIGEIKAWSTNNRYIKSKNSCEDYFYKMKGRILLHDDFTNFKDNPIEFLYIVYAFQFDSHRVSLKNNQTVKYFRQCFTGDADLKKLNVSFRSLGLTVPIENPLDFDYQEFKKDWTKYLYDSKNWEEL